MGSHIYIDRWGGDAAAEGQKLGGARVVLASAPNSKSMSDLFPGLGRNGSMVVVGAGQGNIEVSPFVLLLGKRRLQGWASGTAADSEDTMRFATLTGVRPMIEKFPLEKVAEAYERMNSGHAQFRVVLTM
jgi:D-arabinose 1-dehydrogenase-like Zn-dependent alcohol dehydrogenase